MHQKKILAAAALAVAAAFTLTACSSDSGSDKSPPVTDVSAEAKTKAATVLDTPFTKPDMVLTDTHGKKYDLIKQTKGKAMLIYFGYTHCPDICPLTMGNLAVAKKALPKAEQDKVEIVFVTTDPEQDTPAALGTWLKSMDPSFVGLTGNFSTIQAGARQIGIGIDAPKKGKDGKTVSMHGAQVIAFSPKTDKGYLLYGDDASVEDYTKDLPKIIKGENP
ncbi:SCO family protein [Streptomyces beijiangensis]|uniref:SCO family protein n=1 Tax=Streptomyces beijiangensis TaxID=163361 RepID=A0A939F4K7_9ACTN|nr:SCO family protein [Streptomyces beijiangensis]MBO0510285.1 SCO family protein [Streptomyces beijiangensis]